MLQDLGVCHVWWQSCASYCLHTSQRSVRHSCFFDRPNSTLVFYIMQDPDRHATKLRVSQKAKQKCSPSPCVQKASFGSVRGSSIGTWPFMSQWFVDTWHRAVDRYAASCVEAWHQRRYFLKCCLGSRANQIHKYMQVVQYIKLQDSVHRQLLVVVCARVS